LSGNNKKAISKACLYYPFRIDWQFNKALRSFNLINNKSVNYVTKYLKYITGCCIKEATFVSNKINIMKRTYIFLITSLVMLASATTPLKADTSNGTAPSSITSIAQSEALEERLYEISAMDISSLNGPEKIALRSEVKSIKKELQALDNGGLYISVGAAIIIILLLIIIL